MLPSGEREGAEKSVAITLSRNGDPRLRLSGTPRHPGAGERRRRGGWEPSARIRAIRSQLRTRAGRKRSNSGGKRAPYNLGGPPQWNFATACYTHISSGPSNGRTRSFELPCTEPRTLPYASHRRRGQGRRLTGIRSAAIRPTSDRVREALFSVLGDAVPEARVLDLYAGSGALGIEALSRAPPVPCSSTRTGRRSMPSVRTWPSPGWTTGPRSCGRRWAASWLRRHGPFDLVLIDPPYVQDAPVGDLQALVAGGLLAAGAGVVLETRGPDAPPPVEGLELVSLRRYGDTTLAFLRPPGDAAGSSRWPSPSARVLRPAHQRAHRHRRAGR